jgi:hypothetical protein
MAVVFQRQQPVARRKTAPPPSRIMIGTGENIAAHDAGIRERQSRPCHIPLGGKQGPGGEARWLHLTPALIDLRRGQLHQLRAGHGAQENALEGVGIIHGTVQGSRDIAPVKDRALR